VSGWFHGILNGYLTFEQEEDKAEENIRKHKISFENGNMVGKGESQTAQTWMKPGR